MPTTVLAAWCIGSLMWRTLHAIRRRSAHSGTRFLVAAGTPVDPQDQPSVSVVQPDNDRVREARIMTQGSDTPVRPGHYVSANGLRIYYEDHGQGEPLILVHGGTVSSQLWQAQIPTFAQHFRVLAPDSRGHGRTVNPSDTLSYRVLADDLAAFVHALGLPKPLVYGYSDGGQIALELGMRYPDLARVLVVGAAWFKFTAAYQAWVEGLLAGSPRRRLTRRSWSRSSRTMSRCCAPCISRSPAVTPGAPCCSRAKPCG